MNASTFRNNNLKGKNNNFNNASSSRKAKERNKIFLNPRSEDITTTKQFNDKLFNTPDNISIDDVLYGDFSKPKKRSPVLKFHDVHNEDEPNKKNIKILRKFLKQEAKIINKSDF
jgi:hypothetical protein